MSSAQHRRHKRLYEQILLSRGFSILVGWLLAVLLPFVAFWSWQTLLQPDSGQLTALIVTTLAYVTSHLCSLRLRATYPGGRSAAFIAPQVLILYGLFALCTFMLQLPVSRYLLVASGACATLWLYLEYTLTYKYMSLKLAVVPGGRYTSEILAMEDIKVTPLTTLTLDRRYDGVVADFHQIDDATQRFLTQCALNRTAVYDARQIYESLSGRVEIHRMSENNMGSLLPSPSTNASSRS